MDHPAGSPIAGKRTIGRRIAALVATAVLISVAMITAIFVAVDWHSDIDARKRGLEATGYVFAAALADHIGNHESQEALHVLRAINRIPDITYAAILDADGHVTASMGNAVVLDGQPLRQDFGVLTVLTTGAFPVAVDIIRAGRKTGQVFLIADVSDVRSELLASAFTGLLIGALSSLAGILVARRLRTRITAPMRHMTDAMHAIAATRNYEGRIRDEVGDAETQVMIDSFNRMIQEVHARDDALAGYSRGLEATVAERTRELIDARDAAEEANRAKSSFLSTMSHEIRTPLNGLMVMAELLAGAGLEPRLNRYAEVIVKSGQSLLTIINDVLDLSKIEAGKLELEDIPLDPAAVADDVVSLFWEHASSKGIDLAVRVAANLPASVAGDPVRLNQILSNLVSNALKFTEKGQILLSLQHDGRHLVMSVADSGIGIPADKLKTLFEAFTQADQSITRRFGGTGLGLTICKRLASAMNGAIAVRSEPGKGSMFTVTVEAPVLAPPRAALRPVMPEATAGLAFTGNASLSALGTALVAAGYRVQLVPDDRATQDVIFAPAGRLGSLSISSQRKPKIIGITSRGDTSGEAAVAAGLADDLLALPLRPVEVRETLSRLERNELRGLRLLDRQSAAARALADFSGRRVLVADDNAINREVIIEVLRQLGIATDTAVDGREAVASWKRHRPDLVFMDCSMPELDGYAATREIRAHEVLDIGGARTPVVALTAHIAGGNDDAWRQAGMDAYMTKPFTLAAIVDCLAAHFAGRPMATAPAVPPAAGGGQVLDEDTLAELRAIGGSDALFRRVLDLFASRVPQAVDRIEASLSGDLIQLADAAHALKSMCANIGAGRAVKACHAMEHAARTGEGLDAGAMMADITREIRAALAEVRRLRAA